MKRPMLVCGTSIFISSFLFCAVSKTAAIIALSLCSVALFPFFFKKFVLREKILIPAVLVSVILSSVCFLAFTQLKYEKDISFVGDGSDLTGAVISFPEETAGGLRFTLRTDTVNGQKHKMKTDVLLHKGTVFLYDTVRIKSASIRTPSDELGFPDHSAAGDDVYISAEAESCFAFGEAKKDIVYYCLILRNRVEEKYKIYYSADNAGVLKGMTFGDTSDIGEDTISDFRNSGAAHLLAVSGLHTSLWTGLLIALLTLFSVPEKIKNVFACVFLALFCIISGFTPSVIRASLMTFLTLISPFFKREADTVNSLGFAAGMILLFDPYAVLQPGFLLSVSATAGVCFALNIEKKMDLTRLSQKSRILSKAVKYLISSFLISTFSGIFTLPFSSYFFRSFSIIAPLTNLFAVKPAFYSLVIGLLSAAVSFIPFTFADITAAFISKGASALLELTRLILSFFGGFGFSSVSAKPKYVLISLAAVFAIIITAACIYRARPRKKILKITSVICAAVYFSGIALSSAPVPALASLTVFNSKNGSCVINLGSHYALINCPDQIFSNSVRNSLPHAANETVDLFLVTSFSSSYGTSLENIAKNYAPESTVMNEFSRSVAKENGCELPDNTLIKEYGVYDLGGKIKIQNIDTFESLCVIIYGMNKTVMISSYAGNDLYKMFDAYGTPDILVLAGYLNAEAFPAVRTLIICSDESSLSTKALRNARLFCEELYITGIDRNITVGI